MSVAFAPGLGSGSHTAAAVSLKSLGVDVKSARFVVYKSAGEALIAKQFIEKSADEFRALWAEIGVKKD